METELRNIVLMIKELYATLQLDFYARLSFRDNSDKFLGDADTWKRAESVITKVSSEESLEDVIGPGEAAFYGPKIDFMVRDSLGREWQCATVQLDFVQPERFDLSYVDSDGTKKRPVMIHKALLGSIERFLSVYIEHTAGAFPFWLAPVQVAILPVKENFSEYAEEINLTLKKLGYRTEMKMNETLGKRIRETKVEKIPYALVLGKQEMEARTVTLESYAKGKVGVFSHEELLDILATDLREKR